MASRRTIGLSRPPTAVHAGNERLRGATPSSSRSLTRRLHRSGAPLGSRHARRHVHQEPVTALVKRGGGDQFTRRPFPGRQLGAAEGYRCASHALERA